VTLRKKVTQHKNCHNAECLVLFIVMLNIIMLNVIVLNVIVLNVVVLNVVVLNVIVLNVVVLNVVELTMLNVVVPYCEPIIGHKPGSYNLRLQPFLNIRLG
jgi:hypothetical protein